MIYNNTINSKNVNLTRNICLWWLLIMIIIDDQLHFLNRSSVNNKSFIFTRIADDAWRFFFFWNILNRSFILFDIQFYSSLCVWGFQFEYNKLQLFFDDNFIFCDFENFINIFWHSCWSLVERSQINVLFNNLYKIYKIFIALSWVESLKTLSWIIYVQCQWRCYSFRLKRVYFVIRWVFVYVLRNVLTLIEALFNIIITYVVYETLKHNIFDDFLNL